ncbi:MAG TPA: hypothetical protein VJV23_02970 [Candidatus Polarisedimenticolia bacterium]|nr:hypothetical protein [Candidatus Polarisedimenticolia bacterium]
MSEQASEGWSFARGLAGFRRGAAVAAMALGALAAGGRIEALTDEEIYRHFQFNLVNPGARALGMGGAYIAVADDPTASLANPAGLNFLHHPQFFFEYRAMEEDTEGFRSSLGSLEVDPNTGAGDLPFLGLRSDSNVETMSDPSYIAFTWPTQVGTARRRLTLAGSRHVLLSQERSSGGTEAMFSFDSFPHTVDGDSVEMYAVRSPVVGSGSTEIIYWNASAAIELHQDFSAGLTLSQATLDLSLDTSTFVLDPQGVFETDPGHPRLPEQPSQDVYRTFSNGSDSSVTYAVGIHWHPDSIYASGVSPWRVGAAFRRGARFSVEESVFLNGVLDGRFDNKIVVPDVFSIGASYRFSERLMAAVEVERVEYSDMLDGFRSGVNFLTSGQIAGGVLDMTGDSIEFTVDDGDIVRAGVEYVLPVGTRQGQRLSLRAGWYRTPDSRIRMTRFDSGDGTVDRTYMRTFPGDEADSHITAGVGYDIGKATFSIAGETSDRTSQIVGSFGIRLEKEAK